MVVTFQCQIAFHPGSIFCFGTISSVADEKGVLHRIADPPEKKPSPEISKKAGTRQQIAQPPAPRAKTTFFKSRVGNSLTQRTPLSTSSTEEWTRIMRKKEANGIEARQVVLPTPSPSKKDGKKVITTATPFYPRCTLHRGESRVISHLRQRANHARGRTSSARSSAMEEPTPEYSATSQSWGAGPSAAFIPR
jgi:hypothetical protein